jgi:hypothetical protein
MTKKDYAAAARLIRYGTANTEAIQDALHDAIQNWDNGGSRPIHREIDRYVLDLFMTFFEGSPGFNATKFATDCGFK